MVKKVDDDGKRLATIPADWYCREDVMQVERERIFKKNWQLFARLGQLDNAGDYVANTIAGIPVIACRADDGDLKAFHNVCRHRAGTVSAEGVGNCARLRCSYHGWTYDFNGDLVKAPGVMGEAGFNVKRFSLFPVRCESWNGLVFVNFDMKAQDLLSWLGDIVDIMGTMPRLDESFNFTREAIFDFQANWKAYGDNSCEGYHLPLVHRDMAASIDNRYTKIEARAGEYINFDVTYRDGSTACWIYKYPNFMIACEPAYINIQSTDPVSAGNSRIRDYFWFSPDITTESIEENLRASDLVTGEDRKICENVQRNLEAGIYQRGELSATQEQGTRYFQTLVRRDIEKRLDNSA